MRKLGNSVVAALLSLAILSCEPDDPLGSPSPSLDVYHGVLIDGLVLTDQTYFPVAQALVEAFDAYSGQIAGDYCCTAGIAVGDTEACLDGATTSGTPLIHGCDAVRVVK